jgi:hypothetical protein
MILKTMKYSEFFSCKNAWCLDKVNFGKINLLVGKNSSGKSRTLSVIFGIANLVCGDMPLIFKSGEFELEFMNGENVLQYFLKLDSNIIVKEQFVLNGIIKLDRGADGIGEIEYEETKAKMKFQVPNTQLACVTRRDSIQHPYFQCLYDWGKATRLYCFGSEMGKSSFAVYNQPVSIDQPNFKEPNAIDVVRIYKKGLDQYGEEYNKLIIKSMGDVGYNINEIGVEPNPNIKLMSGIGEVSGFTMYVIEKDIGAKIYQLELSQGMFRCLSLFAQIHYSQLSGAPDLMMIDDIGEGLDFERSTSLIKTLINIATISTFQLIMSTNDRFIMNNVPLTYWHIIQRTGGHCKIFNYENSKSVFDQFAYTGLSNFDFFTTDFDSLGLSH